MGVCMIYPWREICKPVLKLDFEVHDIMESLADFDSVLQLNKMSMSINSRYLFEEPLPSRRYSGPASLLDPKMKAPP
jgi:hypothetical protein